MVAGEVREAPTALVHRQSQHIWVGYNQGVAMQETRGPGDGCGDTFSMKVSLSNPTTSPTNNHDDNTFFRALPGERIGARVPPALRGALGGELGGFSSVGCIRRESVCCGG